jgi:pyruvate/2-oxoglutarate dehydrogenase complex dihydrolipoamide acyltransferase (E2) component
VSSSTTSSVDVTMPQMGVSVAEGTIVEWKKAVGDPIERDEIIASISTDKIDTDVESPASGTLTAILVEVGETVEVGTVLATIDTGGGGGDDAEPQNTEALSEADAALSAPNDAGDLSGDTTADHGAPPPKPVGVGRGENGTRYSPVVMRIAAEHGIDLSTIEGTGRNGRVRKQDVLAAVEGGAGGEEAPMHIESPYQAEGAAPRRARKPRFARDEETPAAAPAAAAVPFDGDMGPAQAGPLPRMRQAIGKAMVNSLQTAATCTTVVEVDLHRVEAERKRLGLTALPFVARATIETLREFPALNAHLEGDTFTQYERVHLGVAVSLGTGGLIVPVIHNAQDLSVEGLSARVKDLARRARDNKLTPDDVHGATFTITNPGGYGSIMATPVINLPQVGILDTEAVVKRPVVIDDAIAIRPMSYFCMSWDHRALDGAYAAQFLKALKDRLEAL